MTPEHEAGSRSSEPRVAVVTGASSGIGLAAAEQLAWMGWRVTLIGRDPDRLDAAVTRVRAKASAPVDGRRCDFAVLAEVRALAEALREAYPHIDLLANNAGGARTKRHRTVDGHEWTIQVNHLAHFLLSHELRPLLRGGRIVNTTSDVHVKGTLDPDDLSGERGRYRTFGAYGSAKQANILFTVEAARRWPEILSTSYHPGVVRTRFGRDSRMMSLFYRLTPAPIIRRPSKGAETLVWLGTTDAAGLISGGYYIDKKQGRPAAKATDPDLAARLWEASLLAVGLTSRT